MLRPKAAISSGEILLATLVITATFNNYSLQKQYKISVEGQPPIFNYSSHFLRKLNYEMFVLNTVKQWLANIKETDI